MTFDMDSILKNKLSFNASLATRPLKRLKFTTFFLIMYFECYLVLVCSANTFIQKSVIIASCVCILPREFFLMHAGRNYIG